MRKNIGNDKVIRAMVIGISAMLASSAPLTALAAEGDEGTGNTEPKTGGEEQKSSNVCDEAQAAADTAQDAVETAKGTETVTGSTEVIKEDVEKNVVAGEANDSKGNDLAKNVIAAAGNVENASAENGTPLAGAETDITNADIKLGEAEANDGLSNSALGTATTEAGKAAGIAKEVNDAMNKANATVDEKIDAIENATSIADANAAYSELEETANKAQADFDDKLADYNDAKAAYDKAVKEIEDCEAAYNAAINNADENAAAAQAKLAEAKKNAEALEAAVAAAKKAVDTSAADAMEIAKKEELTRGDGGLNWRNEDQLFIAIMEKYYLPEKLDITGAKVTRIQGKDNNEYNYFTAVYKDEDGKEQVKYFNFKMDGNSKDDIVIFEKRIEEVKWEEYQDKNPDQYVDKDGKVIDTAAGLKDGTIVGVNDEYLIKNDATKSETLVSDSEVTGTSKEDIFVNEDNAKESWKLDEEGNLVKTVTADVTTITYTDATFTSDDYSDVEKQMAELKDDETVKNESIKMTEKKTYVATGTYIPVFTETVSVIKDYDYIGSEKDALDKAEEDIIDENSFRNNTWFQNDLEDEGYRLLEDVSYDLTATMTDANEGSYVVGKGWLSVTVPYDYPDDYQVTGTATATYAKVTKETVDFDTLSGILSDLGLSKSKENLEIAAKAQVESTGGIWLDDFQWFNFDLGTAEIRYIKGYQITTGEYATQAEAEAALANAIAQAAENAEEPVRTNINPGNTISRVAYQVSDATITTKHSYTVDYLEKTSEKTENTEIATETYGNAEKLTGEIIQNKNYYDAINNNKKDKILLTQKDEAYRAFVDDAKALTGKYARLLEEAQQANEDVQVAQAQVEVLKKKIENLQTKESNLDKLDELKGQLLDAEGNRNNAEETLKEILEKLKGAGITLEDVIDRLTPPTTPGGDDGTTTPTTAPTTTPTVTPVATVPTAAPAAVTVAAANPAAPAPVVQIEEEETPLAPTIDEAGDNDDKEDEKETAIVAIEEEETPLVASVEGNKISWWWWLILLILGATGYEMYKKHEEKKKAAEEAAAKDAE